MKKILGLSLFALTASVLVVGCDENDPAAWGAKAGGGESCLPRDYGTHVVYFPCIGAKFGRVLERYVEQNAAAWEVQAVTGDSTGSYGRNRGYWVVMKKRQ